MSRISPQPELRAETVGRWEVAVRASARTAAGAGCLLIPFLLVVGCASLAPQPPSEEVRAKLGTVAVHAAPATTPSALTVPYTPGRAAAAGAWEGIMAVGNMGGGSSSGSLAGAEVAVILAAIPIGATVGAVYRGTQGTPQEVTAPAEAALRRACAETDFQETLRREVASAVRTRSGHRLGQTGKPGTGKLPQANSVLEVNVLQAGLCGSPYKNATLSFFLQVRVTLSGWPDGTPLYQRNWQVQRGARTFQEWAAHDAQPFRRELAAASRALADDIVSYIFVPAPPPPPKPNWFTPNRTDDSHWRDDGTGSIKHPNWQADAPRTIRPNRLEDLNTPRSYP